MCTKRASVQFGLLAAAVLLAVLLAVSGWSAWTTPSPLPTTVDSTKAPTPPDDLTAAPEPPFFQDMTQGSGLTFAYRNGEEAEQYTMPETLGGGIGLIDYNGDGRLDIYVTGGGYFDGLDRRQIKGHPGRLYENLGGWKFRDVTAAVGLDGPLFYTHGCAVADYDRDGWPDLLVTGWGRLALYHNEPDPHGGRRFREVSAAAGLPEGLWTTAASWADLDGDGFVDLYLCQYVDWSWDNHPLCPAGTPTDPRDVCPPRAFKVLPHKLYRNQGDGTFRDVSVAAGLRIGTDNDGKGLGVLVVDVDGDGRPDICVANDEVENFLYLNDSSPGKLHFEERALYCGIAKDNLGRVNGNMGVTAGDVDGKGRPSIFITTFENEQHGLYRNINPPIFQHWSGPAGIQELPLYNVGWGTGFVDVDGDGWEDLVIAHGHVRRHPAPAGGTLWVSQYATILQHDGKGRYRDVSTRGGSYFLTAHRGRGLAVGDLDNDGRPDLVISNLNEPVALLRNTGADANHWLGVELVGKDGRDATGARVVLEVQGRTLMRFQVSGGSYLSSGDRRSLFGLGPAGQVGRLLVLWPTGEPRQQHWDHLAVDDYYRIVQGQKDAQPWGNRKSGGRSRVTP